jgi:hypothetical protein
MKSEGYAFAFLLSVTHRIDKTGISIRIINTRIIQIYYLIHGQD